MDREEIERLAFLYLCNSKDRAYVNGIGRMGFREYERLQYLAMSLGFTELDILFWRKQKLIPYDTLQRWPELFKLEHGDEAIEAEQEKYDSWMREFCDRGPTKQIRERMREVFQIGGSE